jgi:hypothetical protein
MPRKASNPGKRSTVKKKASARQNAQNRIEEQRGTRGGRARVPKSIKEMSQRRFPGETPLTGEDRPMREPGGKARGQSLAGVNTASGKARMRNSVGTEGRPTDRQTAGRRYGAPGSPTRKPER